MNTIKIDYLIIIPCRRNSSRVKFKNRRIINHKKLYEITIEQAQKVLKRRSHIVVNTDDEEIIKYCKKNNIDFFKRNKKNALNNSKVSDAIFDMLEKKFNNNIFKIKNILLLQVTSPLRNLKDINGSISLFESKNYKSLCSLSESNINLNWINTLGKEKYLNKFLPKKYLNTHSQDLPKSYGVNGAIFISDLHGYIKYKRFFNRPNSIAYIMPESRSIDIDTEFDYKICKALIESNYND